MNLLTKFHEDRTINVASRVKNAPPPDIIGTNLLTKFHVDRTKNVASRVLTRKNAPPPWRPYRAINVDFRVLARQRNNAPPPGVHVFKATGTTNLQTKFHDDWKINLASRVLTSNKCPSPWRPYIIWMYLLTKFHEDWTINVASRVLTSHIWKNAPPLGTFICQANVTIFKLIQAFIKTNLLTKCHEDWTIYVAFRVLIRKNDSPPGGHVFLPTVIVFKLVQDIIGMNLLTKCHEDWTINVASRENASPLSSHVFQANVTIFELIKDII
ncbi:hypothetical protein DPMN_154163 [Dreissena polymorpha]|uniref:Uncharacterized protein n=1 Tax=Dreissena polymorpha TaxID=45954 RepID=A0A9D4FKL5_DREPO|nr:hypothetical protein DPMN_154163 [Dreissena polymorpha]